MARRRESSRLYAQANKEKIKAGRNTEAYRAKKAAYDKLYHAANREQRLSQTRANKLKRVYGLTLEQRGALWEEQGRMCASCGDPLAYEDICVDHCHDNGHVCGLLHSNCNTSIGLLGHSPDRIAKAAAYVARTRTRITTH